jgi:hypothetical protein
LAFCYSFASSGYPKEVNCIVNKYIAGFPNWSDSVPNHVIYSHLEPLLMYEIIELDQIMSIGRFNISGGKSSRDCFDVMIWEMEPSVDTKELCKSMKKMRIDYFDKPVRQSFFTFRNFVIWVNACSYATQFNVYDELDKIIEKCFKSELDKVNVFKGKDRNACSNP